MLATIRSRAVMLTLALAACSVGTMGTRTLEKPGPNQVTSVTTPAKAHLIDGTTVLFPNGVTLRNGILEGAGERRGLRMELLSPVTAIPLDSVAGVEAYERSVDPAASFFLSVLGTAGVAFASAGLAVAIFGSCPTFYSDSAGSWVLEAEGFSYSIAALYEARDVDRLRTTVAPDGTVRIEVRNEALETHFINHLELLDVRHAPHETVVPDAAGRPVAVGTLRPLLRARDANGTDLRATLAHADGVVTRQDVPPHAEAVDHHLDLEVPVPLGADSIALVFRLRNSLLNTVLLYDVMLGAPGLRSLEWQATTLREIGPALELAQWYSRTMGLRVFSVTDEGTRQLAELRDTGPIAFKDVALVIPATATPTMHLRIEHVVDNWRIDRIAVAGVRRPQVVTLPLAATLDPTGRADTTVLATMLRPDGRYLETTPGQMFTAVWRPAPAADGEVRTFLLASQGYYSEWLRRDWLAAPADTTPFRPDRGAIVTALARWRTAQDSLEQRFLDSRLPVR